MMLSYMLCRLAAKFSAQLAVANQGVEIVDETLWSGRGREQPCLTIDYRFTPTPFLAGNNRQGAGLGLKVDHPE